MSNNTNNDDSFDFSLIARDCDSDDHYTRYMYLQTKETPKKKKKTAKAK